MYNTICGYLTRARHQTFLDIRLKRYEWLFGRFTKALTFLMVFAATLRTAWMCDDAFMSWRSIQNLLLGHGLVANAGERVQVFTSALWVLLMIPVHWLAEEPYVSTLVVSLVTTAATVLLLLKKLYRASDMIVIGLILTFSKAFIEYSTSGLENPLVNLLLVILLVIYTKHHTDERTTFWMFLVVSLLGLTRLDTMVIATPILVHYLYRTRKRTHLKLTAKSMALGLVPLASWFVFSLIYYGFPYPNTAYAKVNIRIKQIALFKQGLVYFEECLTHDPVTLITVAITTLGAIATRRASTIMPMLGVLLYLVYVLKIGGDFMLGRFWVAPFVVAVYVLAYGLLDYCRRWKAWSLMACASAPLIMSPFRPYEPNTDRILIPDNGIADERNFYQEHTALWGNLCPNETSNVYHNHRFWIRGLEMKASKKKAIADPHHGLAGYAAGPDVHIVDTAALNDVLLARISELTPNPWRIGHYYRPIPKGYIATLRTGINQIEDPCIHKYYDKVSIVIKGPLFTWERIKTIIELNFGNYETWAHDNCGNTN